MQAKEFYNLAVKLTEDIKNVEPQLVSGSDSEFCMIVTAKEQAVYAGVTSVKVDHGKVMRSCPEFNAIMAMMPSGESRIEKLITVSFSTMEISQPCDECLKLLYQMNKANQNTEIFTSPDKAVRASELLTPDHQPQALAPKDEPADTAKTTTTTDAPIKDQPSDSGFAASSPDAPPPPAMNQAPKNPLASAGDFGDFSGGFEFEAAEPVEEPDEPEEVKTLDQAQQTNPDNPFFQQAPPPDAAPQTMAQPYPQQQFGGYPQQSMYVQPGQQGMYGQPGQQSMYVQPGQQSMYVQPGQQSMYIQPGQPGMYAQPGQQSMYMQPNQQQSMYIQPGQQSMYVQPGQQSMYIQPGQSAHSQQMSAYQSNYYAQQGVAPPKSASSTFKNRLANFMDDDVPRRPQQQDTASPEDLRRQAEERKKMLKNKRK